MDNTEKYIFGSIINNMTDGIIVIGFDGRVAMCSHQAAEALNCRSEDIKGCSLSQLMSDGDENDEFFELLLNAVHTRQKVAKIVPFCSGDEVKYLRVTTSLLTENGEMLGLVAVLSDITESVELFIRNKRLSSKVINMMKSLVEVMIATIEGRSAYNANHTKKMVRYASRYIEWLDSKEDMESYPPDSAASFLMSVWLHDIGKLLIPQEILDKPTRLGTREKDVMHRIETALLMLRIRALSEPESSADAKALTDELIQARDLIMQCNEASELTDETVRALERASHIPCMTSDGSEIPLLTKTELEAISVTKGTLTDSERRTIEAHAVYTKLLLSKMDFPDEYKNIPLWAGGHHEYLDGSGYPDALTAEDIPWEVRLLTILDIYDALTAEDRPYKPAMPPESAFEVLYSMCDDGKLDREVLKSFIDSGAWQADDV